MNPKLKGPVLRKILSDMIRYLFHGMPLVPLMMKRYYLVIAVVLLVLIPYIKVKKLSQLLVTEPKGAASDRNDKEIRSAVDKWRWLTFLKP